MFSDFIPDKLSFTFYKDEEIEKMSVMEVTQPLSLDNFGHPYPNGLCDLRMGPLSIEANCKTCNLSYLHCPGHFGYIRLRRPVYNPLLFSTMFNLLRSTCFTCGFLKVGNIDRVVLYLKLNLLKRGYPIDKYGYLHNITNEQQLHNEIANILLECPKTDKNISNKKHQELTALIFSAAMSKAKCVRCKSRNPKLVANKNLKISKTDESEKIPKHITFYPEEISSIFERLFENDKDLMESIFSTTDYNMFFIRNIAVSPVKFRPLNYFNGKAYENPQNLHYLRILKINNELKENQDYWAELQAAVLGYFDSSKSASSRNENAAGRKQVLEKKEGLFRRNIMGKRVNFAARSVISPDPNLHTREMGIPRIFAEKLTYPEPVNINNYDELRKAVIRGKEYPGANCVQIGNNVQNLEFVSYEKRVAIANQLLNGKKIVWRHLRNNDVVLVNRQPTLHKQSIMGHKVKVLDGEKTLRMHYVNCKQYNADFDGDEMNIHFPQSYAAKAEAEFISLNDNMYLVPTNGEPIRGLSQDHLVAISIITLKNSFFTREEYIDLLSSGLVNKRINLEKPCISKPIELYSGKQIVTTLLKNLNISVNLEKKTKITRNMWLDHIEEEIAVFANGEMMTGVLDKNTVGPTSFSLIHACGQLYGYEITNDLLSYISQIVNRYLFIRGFTLRLDDLLLEKEINEFRDEIIKEGNRIASIKQKEYIIENPDYYINQSKTAQLDSIIRSEMNILTSKIVDNCLPNGLIKKFPENNMSMIIITGAKGSMVNFSQISGALGQQELEGKRVSHMISGKTLPCNNRFEPSPSAGGYVYQRFLTGIKPFEFFFHCMAGREGLIDTAVKTSSSGYLQRCLIKHLEGIKVEYDMTTRIGRNIIQYTYGEDGLDCTKSSFLNEPKFNQENMRRIALSKKYEEYYKYIKSSQSINKKFRDNYDLETDETAKVNYINAMADPGEAVGVIAGQSVGEPSTQMTLNTFHLAGVGSKNVTLGIPRLREIIMVAAKQIQTPIITAPLKRAIDQKILDSLQRLTLADCVNDIKVSEMLVNKYGVYSKEIKIIVTLCKFERYAVSILDTKFLVELGKKIKKLSKISGDINIYEVSTKETLIDADKEPDSDSDNSSEEEDKDELKEIDKDDNKDNLEIEEPDAVDVINDEEAEEKSHEEENNEISEEEEINIKTCNFQRIGPKKYMFTAYYPSDFNIMLLPIIEALLPKIIIKEHCNVAKATVSENNVIFEGSNFHALVEFIKTEDSEVDPLMYFNLYEATSNDIYAISTTFGIEAAREAIINEITNVFDVYGIEIDIRHLMLIADYMTFTGEYRAFNRTGLEACDSPLQKMSFESCFVNLKKASEFHMTDNLENPSASLTVGLPVNVGTSVFDLIYDLESLV